MSQNPQNYFKEICKQLEEDLDAPLCEELLRQFQQHPECKSYFESVQKTVAWYKQSLTNVELSPEMRKTLIQKLTQRISSKGRHESGKR